MTNDLSSLIGEDNLNPDKLLPEIRLYYEDEGVLGPMLRHPLVYQIPFFSWNLANQSYLHKKEVLAQAISKKDWHKALALHERPYRLSTLMEWVSKKKLSTEELRDLLKWAWMDTEMPQQFGYSKIVRLFRKAGFLTDIPGLEWPLECNIYRGVNNTKYKMGVSWALDLSRAQWFAQRLSQKGSQGTVYQAVAPTPSILAIFNGRDEQEVVVDPKRLLDVRIVP